MGIKTCESRSIQSRKRIYHKKIWEFFQDWCESTNQERNSKGFKVEEKKTSGEKKPTQHIHEALTYIEDCLILLLVLQFLLLFHSQFISLRSFYLSLTLILCLFLWFPLATKENKCLLPAGDKEWGVQQRGCHMPFHASVTKFTFIISTHNFSFSFLKIWLIITGSPVGPSSAQA